MKVRLLNPVRGRTLYESGPNTSIYWKHCDNVVQISTDGSTLYVPLFNVAYMEQDF